MAKDKSAVADHMREQQEGVLAPPPRRDVSRYPNEGSARVVVGTVLFYVALPAFLLAVFTLLYSGFYWLKTGAWKNVTFINQTPGVGEWRPSWAMIDYVLTQAHVALLTVALALILFFVCALLLRD